MAPWWVEHDLLVVPTSPEPPVLLGELAPDNADAAVATRLGRLITFTAPFDVTGQPAMSLPLHWNDAGLPIGVQLVAAYGHEDVLIRIAAQLEAARPWADRRPPIHHRQHLVRLFRREHRDHPCHAHIGEALHLIEVFSQAKQADLDGSRITSRFPRHWSR